MIHVNRGATSLGVFSEQEVRDGLSAGRFTPTDIGWREGIPPGSLSRSSQSSQQPLRLPSRQCKPAQRRPVSRQPQHMREERSLLRFGR
jgi:hypothetical protein